jgi:hypothetical protein
MNELDVQAERLIQSDTGIPDSFIKNKIANVSMVFNVKRDMPLPKTHKINGKRYKVIDGDIDDLRFKDKSGVIVGLRAKGKAIKNNGEFVQKVRANA